MYIILLPPRFCQHQTQNTVIIIKNYIRTKLTVREKYTCIYLVKRFQTYSEHNTRAHSFGYARTYLNVMFMY